MKLFCSGRSRDRPVRICNKLIGEDDRQLEPIAIVRGHENMKAIFPDPCRAIKCHGCGWWNVFAPVGLKPGARERSVARG